LLLHTSKTNQQNLFYRSLLDMLNPLITLANAIDLNIGLWAFIQNMKDQQNQ
jgi:hypothetical protein